MINGLDNVSMKTARSNDSLHLPGPLIINHQSVLNSHPLLRCHVWVIVSLFGTGGKSHVCTTNLVETSSLPVRYNGHGSSAGHDRQHHRHGKGFHWRRARRG